MTRITHEDVDEVLKDIEQAFEIWKAEICCSQAERDSVQDDMDKCKTLIEQLWSRARSSA